MEGEASMTAKETARLIDWIKARGMTDADATDCIKYIAGETEPDSGKRDEE